MHHSYMNNISFGVYCSGSRNEEKNPVLKGFKSEYLGGDSREVSGQDR